MTCSARTRFLVSLVMLTLWGLAPSCSGSGNSGSSGDTGTSVSVTISAPGIVSPSAGSQLSDTRPTLTVSTVTVSTGATPTYTFQVATDSGFTDMVAQQTGVSQGSGGQTSWQVTVELRSARYYWRARAEVSGTQGPFSQTGDFTVTGGLLPGDVVVISDPLTDGTTQAIAVGGGQFTDRGWKVTSNADYLRYEVDAISNGFVQWDNVGLTVRGFNADSHMLFGMWDPSVGNFRANAFRASVQKLWGPTHNPPYIRLRWISNGELHEEGGANFTGWDPGVVYTWRLQWGPAAGANTVKLFLDGEEIIQYRYNRSYLPNTHWIEFGVQERGESVIDAIYSKIIIGTRQ